MKTLAIIILSSFVFVELLSLGYYVLAGNEPPSRPWWFRLGGTILEVAAVVLAIQVLS